MARYDFRLPRSKKVESVIISANAGQIQDWGHEFLQPEKVYHKTKGEGAIIFICDTAGEFTHPDLVENCLPDYNRNFSDSDTMEDIEGHGTHCAGIAAAVDNKRGMIGVAPGAKLVALKVLNDKGQGRYLWLIRALEYVASLNIEGYRKVISLSLSGGADTKALHNAIKLATEKGCFIVAAAGNAGYKAHQNSIGWPARHDEVSSVANITEDGINSSSSGGEQIDFAAPGSNIYSTYPPDSYRRMTGTSMAAPQVAGIIALVLGLHPYIQNQFELMDLMVNRSSDWWTEGFDERSGHGIPFPANFLAGSKEKEEKLPSQILIEEIRERLNLLEELI